ncbi:MAG: hypothetical protein H2174_02345 [Vampirovibrio sp.]|nr:hypothetical protein [Vampirovibrio sp.]
MGWDNEARETELGRLPLVNNRNEYHSNEISTPNGAFSVTSNILTNFSTCTGAILWHPFCNP